jgi:hypothetical protein
MDQIEGQMEYLSKLKKECRNNPITVRLPKSAYQLIKKIAKSTNRSQSEIVEIAMKNLAEQLHLENIKKG